MGWGARKNELGADGSNAQACDWQRPELFDGGGRGISPRAGHGSSSLGASTTTMLPDLQSGPAAQTLAGEDLRSSLKFRISSSSWRYGRAYDRAGLMWDTLAAIRSGGFGRCRSGLGSFGGGDLGQSRSVHLWGRCRPISCRGFCLVSRSRPELSRDSPELAPSMRRIQVLTGQNLGSRAQRDVGRWMCVCVCAHCGVPRAFRNSAGADPPPSGGIRRVAGFSAPCLETSEHLSASKVRRRHGAAASDGRVGDDEPLAASRRFWWMLVCPWRNTPQGGPFRYPVASRIPQQCSMFCHMGAGQNTPHGGVCSPHPQGAKYTPAGGLPAEAV